jgi:hypothetical protein
MEEVSLSVIRAENGWLVFRDNDRFNVKGNEITICSETDEVLKRIKELMVGILKEEKTCKDECEKAK